MKKSSKERGISHSLAVCPEREQLVREMVKAVGTEKQLENYTARPFFSKPAFTVATHNTHSFEYRNFTSGLIGKLPLSGPAGFERREDVQPLMTLVGMAPDPWVIPHGGERVDGAGRVVEDGSSYDPGMTKEEKELHRRVVKEMLEEPFFSGHAIPMDSQLGPSFFMSGPASNPVRALTLSYFFDHLKIDRVGDPDRMSTSDWQLEQMRLRHMNPMYLSLIRTQQSKPGKTRMEATYNHVMEEISFEGEDAFGKFLFRRQRAPRAGDAAHNLGFSLLEAALVGGYKRKFPRLYDSGAPWESAAKMNDFIKARGGASDLMFLSGDITGAEKNITTDMININYEEADRVFPEYGFSRGLINAPVMMGVGLKGVIRFTHTEGFSRHDALGYGNPSGTAQVKRNNDHASSSLVLSALRSVGLGVQSLRELNTHKDVYVEIHGDDVIMLIAKRYGRKLAGNTTTFANVPITWDVLKQEVEGDAAHFLAYCYILSGDSVTYQKNINTFLINRLAAENGMVVSPSNGKVVRASNRIGNLFAGTGLIMSSLVYGSNPAFEETWDVLKGCCRDHLGVGLWEAFPTYQKEVSDLLDAVEMDGTVSVDLYQRLLEDDPALIYKGRMDPKDVVSAKLDNLFLSITPDRMRELYPSMENYCTFGDDVSQEKKAISYIDPTFLQERIDWIRQELKTIPTRPHTGMMSAGVTGVI